MDTNSMSQITVFDTTLRDGELALEAKLSIQQKLQFAVRLEAMHVDVIEVGYPGAYRKDWDALFMISQRLKQAVVCGLAGSKPDEIASVAVALKPAPRGRINVFTSTNLQSASQISQAQTLDVIRESVSLARNYRDDVQWTAFDATRSQPDFLCRSIETAIQSGATTITIADSLGTASPETFAQLLETVIHRVPNLDQATIGVHCHDDLDFALENSLLALEYGIRQIECSINGLGARKGNANLAEVVQAIQQRPPYRVNADLSRFDCSLGFK
jgi:2-isopropylmalate synthase